MNPPQRRRKGNGKQNRRAAMDDAVRTNDSTTAEIERDREFARGQFKMVFRGSYTEGPRNSQYCVSKEFIDRESFEREFFASEIRVCEEAAIIVGRFNQEMGFEKGSPFRFHLNMPAIWTYRVSGVLSLVEPLLDNFEKFNSNSGWVSPGFEWMQSLSHFSYHVSGGRFALCDLQGSYSRSSGVILTDPVVMSRTKEFGPTDLGPAGIEAFFARHKCGTWCKAQWNLPKKANTPNLMNLIPLSQGTSMISTINTSGVFKMPLPVVPRTANTVQRRSEDSCAICLNQPRLFGLLSECTHVFCNGCILQWRQNSHACPTCRTVSRKTVPSMKFLSGSDKTILFNAFQ